MLQTQIPKEIRDYREKFIFGLSLRQLGFGGLAIVSGFGSYFALTYLFNMPLEIASYIVVAICIPFMALGFVRIHGRTFEQQVILMFRHHRRSKEVHLYNAYITSDVSKLMPPPLPYKKTYATKRSRKYAASQEIASISNN